jgi:glycosyltransferase involved in cell wall biosynthesis
MRNTVSRSVVGDLSLGNDAFRARDYGKAIEHYFRAFVRSPGLVELIGANAASAREKFRQARSGARKLRVGICGWELAHNAAGRAYILAKLYEGFAEAELIGCIFPKFGQAVWEPIRQTTLPIHTFTVHEPQRFVEQALELVIAHPYDVVHLSKPRAPNIVFGVLYKLVWDAKVIVDVDDEELSFVRERRPLDLQEHLGANAGRLPTLTELTGPEWTRLAVGLVGQFDGVTVSNPELQKRYGGSIIPHARDEALFQPSEALTRASRIKYGVPVDKAVVLFFGTPRRHKGLMQTAHAVAALKRDDIVFVIVGDFDDPAHREELQTVPGLEIRFIGNQPFDAIPEIASLGDFCVLLQRPTAQVTRFQAPAKVSDALAMGLIVLAARVPPLRDFFDFGACVDVAPAEVTAKLEWFLSNPNERELQRQRARGFYLKSLSFGVVARKLHRYVDQIGAQEAKASAALARLVATDVFPHWLAAAQAAHSPDTPQPDRVIGATASPLADLRPPPASHNRRPHAN